MSEIPGVVDLIRETRDNRVTINLRLKGRGRCTANSGIPYLDSLLMLWAAASRTDLELRCEGMPAQNQHPVVENTGMTLGHAVHAAVKSLGSVSVDGVGTSIMPMDEVLARVVMEFSGRPYLHFDLPWHVQLGPMTYDFHLTKEFFWGFVRTAGVTVHVDMLTPGNNHHMSEAVFKAFGRAFRDATHLEAAPMTSDALTDLVHDDDVQTSDREVPSSDDEVELDFTDPSLESARVGVEGSDDKSGD